MGGRLRRLLDVGARNKRELLRELAGGREDPPVLAGALVGGLLGYWDRRQPGTAYLPWRSLPTARRWLPPMRTEPSAYGTLKRKMFEWFLRVTNRT